METLLNAESLRLRRGGVDLLDSASFEVRSGERLGLVGPNGSGKSTLLDCLAGRLVPAEGRVRKAPGVRIAYLPQESSLDPSIDVAKAIEAALEPLRAAEAAMRAEEALLASGRGSLEAYGRAQDRFERAGGYGAEARIREALGRFGLGATSERMRVGDLSGGQRRRLALALALSADAEMLLLDEPTTHLDLPARAYLVERLRASPATVLIATHDRYVLREACTGHLALREGAVRRSGDAPGERPWRKTRLPAAPRAVRGPAVFARHLTVQLEGRRLLDDVGLRVDPGERIAVVGANGSGKSTLLAWLAGERVSDDVRAARRYGAGVRVFWADQHDRGLASDATVLEQLERWVSAPRARELLGLARLPREAWHLLPSSLSGGQRARAGLALMVAMEANLWLLDEPDAHLDLEGIELLETLLRSTPAAVVLASHDRALIERVATRILWLDGGRLHELHHGLDERLPEPGPPGTGAPTRNGRKGTRTGRRAGRPSPMPTTGDDLAAPSPDAAEAAASSSSAAAAEGTNAAAAEAAEALEDERARLEELLLDPRAVPERERRRIQRRLRDVLDELSERYDRQYPPPPPRVSVREAGVRFGAVPDGNLVRVVGAPGASAVVHQIGRIAHVSTTSDAGADLTPWGRCVLVRAAMRLAFYLLAVDAVQTQSRTPLEEAGLEPAGNGWWICDREAFERSEGWPRSPESGGTARRNGEGS